MNHAIDALDKFVDHAIKRMEGKSIKEFPRDVQNTVHEILSRAAERKAKANQAKGA